MTDIQLATLDDLHYLDDLQNRHRWALGFLPRAAHRAYVEAHCALLLQHNGQPAGFLIWRASRHPLLTITGIGVQVLQICVEPGLRRVLHGTGLLDALDLQVQQATPTYTGCWCASDLDATHFWRALGFRHDLTRDLLRAGRIHRTHKHWTRPES